MIHCGGGEIHCCLFSSRFLTSQVFPPVEAATIMGIPEAARHRSDLDIIRPEYKRTLWTFWCSRRRVYLAEYVFINYLTYFDVLSCCFTLKHKG